MDLAKTNAQWLRLLGKELGGAGLAPLRLLREIRDRFARERTQVWNLNDATSATAHLSAISFDPGTVDYNVNTAIDGTLYVRITANGANWDVKLYKATGGGAGDLVAQALNVAASGTATLAAQNSSGLTGSVTLGATIAAETNDRHQLLLLVDFQARLKKIFTGFEGTAAVEDDEDSRSAFKAAYERVAARLDAAIADMVEAIRAFALSAADNPVARGNDFTKTNESTLLSEVQIVDNSGNVRQRLTGWFPTVKQDMKDETTGSAQDVVRIVPSGAAGVFSSANKGKGTVAAHTPGERSPPSTWRFKCVRGTDTSDLGSEEFEGEVNFTRAGDDRRLTASGLKVGKQWAGPLGFGAITLKRTFLKTGDGTNVQLAAASDASLVVTGETNDNSASGVWNWKIVANGANWDVEIYKTSALAAADLVAKATNVATAAAFTASAQNGSGLTIAWKTGTAPTNGATGTLDAQPFYVENANKLPDEFTVTVTEAANPGLYQKTLRDTAGLGGSDVSGVELASDASGSESIKDDWVRQGTFVPFAVLDN